MSISLLFCWNVVQLIDYYFAFIVCNGQFKNERGSWRTGKLSHTVISSEFRFKTVIRFDATIYAHKGQNIIFFI